MGSACYLCGVYAYFDDSGHPDDQDVVIVAGFVATLEQWKRFHDEWRKTLTQAGIRSGVFRMTDFEARKEGTDYPDIPERRRPILLNALIGLICTRTRFEFHMN